MGRGRLFWTVPLVALALLAACAGSAAAFQPEDTVGGNGSKWYSGSGLQMAGQNCSVIGNSYTEIMVNAVAEYGGAPAQSVPHVNDPYYVGVLISIPGNPCGPGSASVGTDLFLPHGVSVDNSRPIRCFGKPNNSSGIGELTGGNWNFLGSSGPYCPASVGPTQSGAPGTIGVGFRPLASGQLYWLFVPVKSSQQLLGAGENPAAEFHWFISASGVYESPQASSVWANVVPAGAGNTPFIYFARNPTVIPYWDNGTSQSKAEWFANLYSAGYAGNLCFDLYDNDPPTGSPTNCSFAPAWNGAVPAGGDSFQVFGEGPNGGFVPFAYTNAQTYTIRWSFTYNPGSGNRTVTKDVAFTALAGPDADGDGVPDASDACPATKGTQANGCLPAVQSDPDGDGIFGASDKCPGQNGGASLDGCPKAQPAATDSDGDGVIDANDKCPAVAAKTLDGCPAAIAFKASLAKIKGNKLKRSALAGKSGVTLSLTCALDAKATATLSLSKAVAKKLKFKLKAKQKTLAVGSGTATCKAGKTAKLKLKLKRALAGKVRKPRKAVSATLIVVFTHTGAKAITVKRAVSLT